jgi:hypothetical protein
MEMDCIPAGMELFPAADEEQFAFIKRIIDDCDYYILIIGGRYGTTTTEGVSYTEREYDYAVSKGIDVLAFLHGSPDEIPVGKSDIDPQARKRLIEFRRRVSTGRLVKFWNSAAELPGLVALSLQKTIKSHPQPGWVRGGSASNQELLEQLNELRQRKDDLQNRLNAALADRPQRPDLHLAPPESKFALKGTYMTLNSRGGPYHWSAEFSWNEIIALIGPHLFQPLAESGVNTQLATSICSNLGKTRSYSERVDDEIFSTLKIQLLALGYISLKSLPTKDHGMVLFWSITPQGQEVMLQERTIKANK